MHYLVLSIYIYIRSIWPQMVVEHNQRSTWARPLRELRDAPLGARRQRTHHQHSAAPLVRSKRNSSERAVLAWAVYESGEKIWYYPALRIHEVSDRPSQTKSWEIYSGYLRCRIWWDGNEMMSIYSLPLCPPPLPLYICTPAVAP